MINRTIKYFLENRVVTVLLLLVILVWGISTAPFSWHGGIIPRDPIPVDAIPDIGENQQIVATEWMGRSPLDVQDQITYPLTTTLLGIPGVKSIRSTSMFGMSFIYVIFHDDVEFYWSRSRILEKLNSLPAGMLPKDVQPALGPDATALGQVFWYTLEGKDPQTGKATGGWAPDELRTIQDFYVKYSLSTAQGVSEVASVGGFVKEYQVNLKPDAMKAYGVTIPEVTNAIEKSNLDVGAQTVEINLAEYLIRGLGYLENLNDLEQSVVKVKDGAPVKISDIAWVTFGPAPRRGGLDKDGVDVVGGVVVARYGSNPLEVINNVKEKIEQIAPTLPEKTLANGERSRVSIVPFYDRTLLIRETIGTLESALSHEILICIIVIIILIFNFKASIAIAGMLPLAVLATFVIMKLTGVAANIVALSGIAIAIGVMVDVGVVFVESVMKLLERPENQEVKGGQPLRSIIYEGVSSVSSAIAVAMITTIVSFLPVFAMQGQEGKLFSPLAYTKTFALSASFILGIVLLPTLLYFILSIRIKRRQLRIIFYALMGVVGVALAIHIHSLIPLALTLLAVNNLLYLKYKQTKWHDYLNIVILCVTALLFLSQEWLPVGPDKGIIVNFLFVVFIVALILGLLWLLVLNYEKILRWSLKHRWKFMTLPLFTLLLGVTIWQGFDKIFSPISWVSHKVGWQIEKSKGWEKAVALFPGMGQEFMPSLNEGSFLLMPTTVPLTGVEQNVKLISILDKRVEAIPEVESAVGKWGRVNSALDPAPIQMYEITINYKPEFALDANGHRRRFKVDKNGAFLLIDSTTYNPANGFRSIDVDSLIPNRSGDYIRLWRPTIKSDNDIWEEISAVAKLPGMTSAPKLQPIEARLVMLSTGMRAPMGVKVYGPDLESIDKGGEVIENVLKEIDGILPPSVYFNKALGAAYLEIDLHREKLARYGLKVADVQQMIGGAIGGTPITTTVEGRERFAVRLRYPRELRNSPETISQTLIPTAWGSQIPLSEVATVTFRKGAQMVKSEDTFLVGYIIFDKEPNVAEVDVVNRAADSLSNWLSSGRITLPRGVSYAFAGNYAQQERATKRLLLVVPLSLLMVLLVLYFQFKSVTASFIHFSGVFVAFAGGFIMLWFYSQPWFLNFDIGEVHLRELFQIHPINLSVAVWVGFIALFGIATDDGVLMGTYIHDLFIKRNPQTKEEIRETVVEAGKKRVRPAAMTTATTLIALLPVLSSTGKGAEIMVPMAIPTFGGMLIQSMTMFIVPIVQCWWRESVLKRQEKKKGAIE